MRRCLRNHRVATLVLGVVPRLASDDVRMIEVAGEGAKFWPRWRGPSGQGLVAPGKYTNAWYADEQRQVARRRFPARAIRRRLSGAIASI